MDSSSSLADWPAAIMLASTLNTFLSSSKRIWERTPSTTTSCSSLVSSARRRVPRSMFAPATATGRSWSMFPTLDTLTMYFPSFTPERRNRPFSSVLAPTASGLLVLASISCTVANAIGSPLPFSRAIPEMSPFAYAIAGSNAIAARIFICLFIWLTLVRKIRNR